MYNWCSDGTSLLLHKSFSFGWHFPASVCLPYLFRPKILDCQQQQMPLGEKSMNNSADRQRYDRLRDSTWCALLLHNSFSFDWHFAANRCMPYLFWPKILDRQQQQMPLGKKAMNNSSDWQRYDRLRGGNLMCHWALLISFYLYLLVAAPRT